MSTFRIGCGGGEESRTPVQKHCYIGFSERSQQFEFRPVAAR